MSDVSDALADLDEGRALIDDSGLCPYVVTMRIRTWTGERVGIGTSDDQLTPIQVARGGRPQVKTAGMKSFIPPGNLLQVGKFEVGPLTPVYDGGGFTELDINPRIRPNQELHFIVQGPGCPPTGLLCKRTDENLSSPFRFVFTLESLGKEA